MNAFSIIPDLLYQLPTDTHNAKDLVLLLGNHPEICFVSLVGIDMAGNDTDEKIPVSIFLDNLDGFLNGYMIQTDGSSVVLPGIATLNDGRIDFEIDKDVIWFVDYNYDNIDPVTEKPIGTLRIPSFLIHNGERVCSRSILKRASERFSQEIREFLFADPSLCTELGFSLSELVSIELLVATELEFWVSSPDDRINTQQLSVSENLKDQYWKRTKGVVRTALEQSVLLLGLYGFKPEMAHKEVGGIKAHLSGKGEFHNILEQLEIDWQYAFVRQAADYELFARIMIKEVFRLHGLDVSFSAKPLAGVPGNGEHIHLNAIAICKDGRRINLFLPTDPAVDYLGKIGWGSLFGFMKHYSLINSFVSTTNDAFMRLQPGFEAPTHVVASLGLDIHTPSRNRTVLLCLIRNSENYEQTRFEIRSPNPHTNTYLCISAISQCMLDGIRYAVHSSKSTKELENMFCKEPGEHGDYLEDERCYRSEDDIFEKHSAEERNRLFGTPPATVYESIRTLLHDDALIPVLCSGSVFTDDLLASYAHAMLDAWQTDLSDNIIFQNLTQIRNLVAYHNPQNSYDEGMWKEIDKIKNRLAKDTQDYVSIFKEIRLAIDAKNLRELSRLQLQMSVLQNEVMALYAEYCQNQI